MKEQTTATSKEKKQKKQSYQRPELVKFGKVKDLTLQQGSFECEEC